MNWKLPFVVVYTNIMVKNGAPADQSCCLFHFKDSMGSYWARPKLFDIEYSLCEYLSIVCRMSV